jgi:hypothetical protein
VGDNCIISISEWGECPVYFHHGALGLTLHLKGLLLHVYGGFFSSASVGGSWPFLYFSLSVWETVGIMDGMDNCFYVVVDKRAAPTYLCQ